MSMNRRQQRKPLRQRDKFARMIVQVLRRKGVTEPIRYDSKNYRLMIGDNLGMLKLQNFYKDYYAAPGSQRIAVIDRYTNFLTDFPTIPEDFNEAAPNLLPRVYLRYYEDADKLQRQLDGSEDPAISRKSFADHFVVQLAYTLPDLILSVDDSCLDTWKVNFEEALAVSRDNLRKISQEDMIRISPGLYVSPWKDNYDSSRLYLPELFQQLDVKGDLVALAPHRDVLIVTGSDDHDGLRRMAQIGTKALKESHSRSGIPVRLQGNHWQVFVPDQKDPELRQLYLESVVEELNAQQPLLQKHCKKEGMEVFVASAFVGEIDEIPFTVSAFAEGADTILPATDYIALISGPDRNGESPCHIAKWEDIEGALGDRMMALGVYPERYRVDRFPDLDQIPECSVEFEGN